MYISYSQLYMFHLLFYSLLFFITNFNFFRCMSCFARIQTHNSFKKKATLSRHKIKDSKTVFIWILYVLLHYIQGFWRNKSCWIDSLLLLVTCQFILDAQGVHLSPCSLKYQHQVWSESLQSLFLALRGSFPPKDISLLSYGYVN